MKKLKSGHTALVPGKPEASEIVARMSSDDPEEQMPPKEHREKHPLTRKGSRNASAHGSPSGAEWKPHWAYRPVVKPRVPRITNPESPITNPIDRFILAKLAAQQAHAVTRGRPHHAHPPRLV